MRPCPVLQRGRVRSDLITVSTSLDLLIPERLTSSRTAILQASNAINGIHCQAETIGLVTNGQFERGVDVALLLVASDVQVVRAGTLVAQAVDHEGVAVEVEDDGLVLREDGNPLRVGKTMWMVLRVDELEEVDNVDAADLEVGEMLEEQVDSGKGFLGGDVTTGSHNHVGLFSNVCAELWPDTDTLCAVSDGIVHAQVLDVVLLVSNNDVHVTG